MGFSLSRALAGAVVGGAHAAGQVFDAQLAEAAKDRARQEDELRAMRQAEYADKLLGQREDSKRAYGEAQETKKRKLYSDLVQEQIGSLKEKGVAIGSAVGQDAIAQAFIEKGYPEFANTFSDNAQRAREAETKKEERAAQIKNAAATHALARETKNAAREGRMAETDKAARKEWNDALGDFEIKTKDADGNTSTDPTYKNWLQASTASLAAKNPFAALDRTIQLGQVLNEVKDANPGMSPFKITQLAEKRVRDQQTAARGATFNSTQGAGSRPTQQFNNITNAADNPAPEKAGSTWGNSKAGGFLGAMMSPGDPALQEPIDTSAGVPMF